MDLVMIREELKRYEAEFMQENNRQPGRSDIKLNPNIAEKYKIYAKSKSTSTKTTTATQSTASDLPSTVEARNDIFKTPTKARPKKATLPAKTTPKIDSTSSTSADRGRTATTYIVANSPSKLRALSAAYATSSPNHPSTKPINEFVVMGNPEKFNPFRSAGPSSPKKLSRRDGSIALLGGGGIGGTTGDKGWERVFSGATMRKEGDLDDMDVDDALLGPSPVKPARDGKKAKEFKPLFESAPLEIYPSASTAASTSTRFSSSAIASTSTIIAPTMMVSRDHPALQPLRGNKRSSTAPLAFDSDLPVEKVVEMEEVDDDRLSDGEGRKTKGKGKGKGKAKSKGRVPKLKKARTSGPTEDAIVELNTDGRESSASLRRRNEKDIVILDVGGEEAEDGEDEIASGRVLIHPRRPYYSRMKDGPLDVEEADEGLGTIDGTGSLYYRDQADLLASDNVFFTTPRDDSNIEQEMIDSSDESEDAGSVSASPRKIKPVFEDHIIDATSVPASMLSILSLRSSPIKKTSLLREKQRDLRIQKLLQDPTLRRQHKGLSDLVDEDLNRSRREAESDDDWASEAEGWKDLGDGDMDDWDTSS